MQESDDQTGFARHGGVHRVAGGKITEDGICNLGWAASTACARFLNPIFQCREKSIVPIQFKGYLRDQSEIHILVRQSGSGRDEPGVPPHKFHER